jgi:hypothetical protein
VNGPFAISGAALLRSQPPRKLDRVAVEQRETAVIAFRVFTAALVGLFLISDAAAENAGCSCELDAGWLS